MKHRKVLLNVFKTFIIYNYYISIKYLCTSCLFGVEKKSNPATWELTAEKRLRFD